MIPDRAPTYGERVRRRLTDEMTIWLTTVGRDDTPQPNLVGFLWDGGDSLVTYSQAEARRLANIRRHPRDARRDPPRASRPIMATWPSGMPTLARIDVLPARAHRCLWFR
jgi:Pyridoxamine 5'-phosphate oxidase